MSAMDQLIEQLRRDAGDYAVVRRGEEEPGVAYSWDQRNVRAWLAAESLAAYKAREASA